MRKVFLLLLYVLFSTSLFSQHDSLIFTNTAEIRTVKSASEPIYNGREHIGYNHTIKGTPYFLFNDWQKGTLTYQEVPYKDLFLKYDLVADEVIVRHINGFSAVTLFSPRIVSFSLGDKHFVNISGNEPTLNPGIYEELIKGKMSLYARRSKLFKESIVSNVLEKEFVTNDAFYVKKDGHYYIIRKEKDIINLIKKEKNISAWIKESGIKYKAYPEGALKKIVEYFNQVSS